MSHKPGDHAATPEISRSNQIFERSKGLIPAHTQTLAKGPGQWVQGAAPKYLQRGKGSRVWDVDGNEYIDLVNGYGATFLGHNPPVVTKAVMEQIHEGDSICLSREPWTFLYAPTFHPGKRYSLREAESREQCGEARWIE